MIAELDKPFLQPIVTVKVKPKEAGIQENKSIFEDVE